MAKKKDSQFAVKFFKGTSEQYNSITPNPYTFYFITDTNKVYLGDIQLSNKDIAEQISNINTELENKASIQMKTKQQWDSESQKIAQENTIYVYTNAYKDEDEHGNIINVPGIKIGDGAGYLIDLPLIGGSLGSQFEEHIRNMNIHVTLTEKEFWNNKVRTQDSEILDEQNLIFTIY